MGSSQLKLNSQRFSGNFLKTEFWVGVGEFAENWVICRYFWQKGKLKQFSPDMLI